MAGAFFAAAFLAAAFLAGAFLAGAFAAAAFLAGAFLAGAFLAAAFFLAGAFLAAALVPVVAALPASAVRPIREATCWARSSREVMPTLSSWWATSLRTWAAKASRPLRLRSSSSSTLARASSLWNSPFWTSSCTNSSALLRVMLVKAIPASRYL